MTTGTSGPGLATKLGIGDDATVVLLGLPPGVTIETPPGVVVRRKSGGQADVVVAFFTKAGALEARIGALEKMIFPAGGLWIAWPKRSSGLVTDLSDHAVREVALPRGLVDNKVCAVDENWTALRLVWRRSSRR